METLPIDQDNAEKMKMEKYGLRLEIFKIQRTRKDKTMRLCFQSLHIYVMEILIRTEKDLHYENDQKQAEIHECLNLHSMDLK